MIKRMIAVTAALAMVFGSTLLPAAESDGVPVNTQKSTLNAQNGTKSADFDTKLHIFEPIRPVRVISPERINYDNTTGGDVCGISRGIYSDESRGSESNPDEVPEDSGFTAAGESEDTNGQVTVIDTSAGDSGSVEDPEPEEVTTDGSITEEFQETEESGSMEYLGDWTITAYCSCPSCCGEWSGSGTASGAPLISGHTAACNILPFGSQVMIGDCVYTIEDTGYTEYGDYWIDIYFDTHDEALIFGTHVMPVYLVG